MLETYFGGPQVFVRRMHTPNFGVYQLLSITSVCKTLSHVCESTRSRFWILPLLQQANEHIVSWRHNLEDHKTLSVERTPPSLVSISLSTSPLSVKLCPIWMHRSVEELEFYCIISRLMPIFYARGIIWRAVGLCPSNAHSQLWCLSAPIHHLCLLNFVPCVCMDLFKS